MREQVAAAGTAGSGREENDRCPGRQDLSVKRGQHASRGQGEARDFDLHLVHRHAGRVALEKELYGRLEMKDGG